MKICAILNGRVGSVHLVPGLLPPKNPIDAAGIFMTRFHPPTSVRKKSNGTRPCHIADSARSFQQSKSNPFILAFFWDVPKVCWNCIKNKCSWFWVRIGMRILDSAITIYTLYISNIICHQIRSNAWVCFIGESVGVQITWKWFILNRKPMRF